jgi:hypothetical protein
METVLEALWTTANPKAEEAITAIKAALAQPAHVISEKEQLKQWIATTNYYRAKREYEPDAAQPAQEPGWVWACNECGSQEFTSILSEADLKHLACAGCGCDEFHKEAKLKDKNNG